MDDTESKSVLGMRTPILVVVTSLVLGGIALLVSYITGRFSRQLKTASPNKNVSGQQDGKTTDETGNSLGDASNNPGLTAGSNGSASNTSSSGKRAKNKKRREAQQEFTHSWMVGALKGHTGPVLDMNFSSNGKFLASCAEDCDLVPEEEPELGDASGGEGEYVLTSSTRCKVAQGLSKPSPGSGCPSSSSTTSPSSVIAGSKSASSKVLADAVSPSKERADRTSLSRRQRKNRTRAPREQQRRDRDDENDDDSHHHRQSSVGPAVSRHRHHHRLLQHHSELNSRHFHQESPTRDSTDSGSSANQPKPRSAVSRRVAAQSLQQSSGSKVCPGDSKSNESGVPGATASGKKSDASGVAHAVGTKKSKGSSSHHQRPSSQRDELNHLSDAALAALMRRYTLTGMQLAHLGYPVECSYFPGYAIILNHQQHPMGHRARGHQHNLDANAREFVPGSNNTATSWRASECEVDSGNGSGSSVESSDLEPECSSDSDKNSDIGESSSSSSSSSSSGYADKSRRDSRSSPESWGSPDPSMFVVVERPCVRCHKTFYVNRENGKYINEDKCVYHWGKLRNGHDRRQSDTWECCKGREEAAGCTTARTHVWTGLSPGYNGPFDGYVRTRPSRVIARDGNYGVYALDCEMCFTRRGLELAKVTLVGMDGRIVYDTLVKPDDEVIDHNTRFSGITAKDLARATKTLRDVQKDLVSFVHAETILIGHGLENDLRALRLLHTTVIDTCVAFPHFLGYPFRSSLKTLARTVLRREIQVTEHDSVEDARIAIDLMLRRLQHDLY